VPLSVARLRLQAEWLRSLRIGDRQCGSCGQKPPVLHTKRGAGGCGQGSVQGQTDGPQQGGV